MLGKAIAVNNARWLRPLNYIDFLRESETKKEFDDIHPFVVFAIFSRLFLIGKKQTILEYFKKEFDLKSEIPVDFDGIPSINPQKSFWGLNWFKDDSEMIKQNWDLFEIASAEKLDEERFIKAFDLVIQQNGAKWNVTHALFRAFPDKFLSLDENSRNYLTTHGIQVMKDKDFNLYQKYLNASNKLAEHVYQRGLNFPTETLIGDEHEAEMEDGSISCSALTLLYYSTHIERNEAYIKKAKEILSLHEAWVVQTPLCNTYRSSLRWWETIWEGDADGPAVCYGHAWTIWRAEADYWMYVSTNEKEFLLRAINSFNTNFAKIHEDGSSYSMYCLDYFTGGGRLGEPKFRLSKNFPTQKDSGLTRYVWIRAFESVLKELK